MLNVVFRFEHCSFITVFAPVTHCWPPYIHVTGLQLVRANETAETKNSTEQQLIFCLAESMVSQAGWSNVVCGHNIFCQINQNSLSSLGACTRNIRKSLLSYVDNSVRICFTVILKNTPLVLKSNSQRNMTKGTGQNLNMF